MLEKLLTADEVAALLRCHVMTVYKYGQAGTLPQVRLGRCVRFREEDVAKLIAASTVQDIIK